VRGTYLAVVGEVPRQFAEHELITRDPEPERGERREEERVIREGISGGRMFGGKRWHRWAGVMRMLSKAISPLRWRVASNSVRRLAKAGLVTLSVSHRVSALLYPSRKGV
jgi:hypothetical protein